MDMECKFCGKEVKGRADKQYCDNQCRSAYHNSNKNEKEEFIKRINKKLRKNRMLLKFASPVGKTTVRHSFLTNKGFDFRYFTNIYTTKNGSVYRFCYDYGWLEVEDDKLLIVNWQPYMDQ